MMSMVSGAPCDNYRGYCDVFRKCRSINEDGPLARLTNLLFSQQALTTVRDWITVSNAFQHWNKWLYSKNCNFCYVKLQIMNSKLLKHHSRDTEALVHAQLSNYHHHFSLYFPLRVRLLPQFLYLQP